MTSNNELKNVIENILKIILYFDAFDYPLNLKEVCFFSSFSEEETANTLVHLEKKNIVYKINEFYCLTNEFSIVERRIKGNIYAKTIMIKANKMAKLISKFPYIEGVSISGSLSKNYFEEEDDVDFFIITSPKRLWLSKTILIAFKKIFLLNSKKYFCVNYFISSNDLELMDKNLFTAVEFVTLIPVLEKENLFENFRNENIWVKNYFPNHPMNKNVEPIKKYKGKQFLEFLLNGFIGNCLEQFSKKITQSFQQKKYKKLQKKDFNIAFKGDDTVSKHHPDNHQKKVITLLNTKIEYLNKKFNLNIPLEN